MTLSLEFINISELDSIKITLYYDFMKYVIEHQEYIETSTKNIFLYIQCLVIQITLFFLSFFFLRVSLLLMNIHQRNITSIQTIDQYYNMSGNHVYMKISLISFLFGISILTLSFMYFRM